MNIIGPNVNREFEQVGTPWHPPWSNHIQTTNVLFLNIGENVLNTIWKTLMARTAELESIKESTFDVNRMMKEAVIND